jgi:acetylornithine deacetylase/succinyl-diaminopimelate desuccinylase-like protein
MKGGIACLLQALTKFHKTHGLYLLFDVGEEYDFKGMQTFLSNFNSVPPELVIFPEPGLYITNGHRGVIEVKFRVRGETGHAKQPDKEGGNAIIGATDAVKHLKTELQHFRDDKLGESTCNLSYMYGGLDSSKNSKGKLRIKIQANKIPDIAEVLLDIRPAKKELNAKKVFEILRKYLEEKNFKLEETESNLNRGPILIPLNKLHSIEDVIKEVLGEVTYGNLGTFGYSEGGLLYEKLKSPWVCFGPGPGDTLHEANEYVNVGDLDKVSDIYRRIIEVYCGDETTAG